MPPVAGETALDFLIPFSRWRVRAATDSLSREPDPLPNAKLPSQREWGLSDYGCSSVDGAVPLVMAARQQAMPFLIFIDICLVGTHDSLSAIDIDPSVTWKHSLSLEGSANLDHFVCLEGPHADPLVERPI